MTDRPATGTPNGREATRDLVITLPATTDWTAYQRELRAVRDGRGVLNFRVPFCPQRTQAGRRCYLVYRGAVRGWMEITALTHQEGFTCSVTGAAWPDGWYVQRAGAWHALTDPLPLRGFQGFRYAPDEWRAQPCT